MHVPYSMDDREPDLGCGFGGHTFDYPPDDRDLGSPWGEPVRRADPPDPPKPMYVFWSEEELARSEVFQRLLNRTLVHKDRQIEELRIEILGML